MNPEFESLGWEITIYNDVLVSLKEGEVISISYDNTDYGSSPDDVELIFTENNIH